MRAAVRTKVRFIFGLALNLEWMSQTCRGTETRVCRNTINDWLSRPQDLRSDSLRGAVLAVYDGRAFVRMPT
jgi:hypothetical protein